MKFRWLALMLVAIGLLAVATFDSGPAETALERTQRLSDSYACPVCDGQSVSESNVAVAATIRDFIADEVAGGASDLEIRDDLIKSYGGEVLLTPPADGIAIWIWILPVMVMVLGGFAVIKVVTRRRELATRASEADAELVAEARSSEPRS